MEEIYQADYLTSAARKFPIYWFKITFLGEVETAVGLSVVSWFADVGISTNNSILGLLPLVFLNNSPF